MADSHVPLPERMRPTRLEEVVGQPHLLGPRGSLRRLTAGGRLPSMVLWGPPGTGKTTLARILAQATGHEFLEFSGAGGTAAELKKFLVEHRERPLFRSVPPVVFLDEIHRFNRAQQDILLPSLERGEAILVGATTENPAFYLNPALRSRCQLIPLRPLPPEAIGQVLDRAWAQERPGEPPPAAVLDWLSRWAGGDLRSALTGLETWLNLEPGERELETLREALGGRIQYRPGRRPLRPGQRLPEEPAGFRSGRGPVLPFPHDPWRRGSALHRPAPGGVRRRGRGQRRPPGLPGGRSRQPRR